MDEQIQIPREFPENLACMQFIERLRWPEGARCIRCGADVAQFVSGGRCLYQCRNGRCRYQFGPTTGTLLHDSRVPLQKWFYAIALVLATEEGLSVRDAQRELRIGYKTAWYLCHRIRAALHPDRFTLGAGLREGQGAKRETQE